MPIVTCPRCGAKNRVDDQRAQRLQPVCGRCGEKLGAEAGSAAADGSDFAAGGEPVEVTDQSLTDILSRAGDRPVLVDFWAPWCGPCRLIAPFLGQLAAESAGRYVIAKLNTDENPRSVMAYGVEGFPTMILFKGGRPVDRLVGAAPKQRIASFIARHL